MPPEKSKALVQTIKKIQIFNDLSPSQAQKVLALCVPRTYESGQVLCAPGSPSSEMFVLVSGELAVMSQDGLRLATLQPITTVGEMGIITRQKRAARVEAIAPSKVLVIEKGPLDLLLNSDPAIRTRVYYNIIQILSSKIVNDNVRVRDHLLEKVRSEKQISELRRRLDISIELAEEQAGMGREQIVAHIDDRMVDETLRVLIVDDEPTVRNFVKVALEVYEVMEAGDGEEALAIIEKVRPDLVITDIKMPRMDGYALADRLKEQYPNLPVVALSGYVTAEELVDYDFAGFIDKPMRLEDFKQVVEGVLVRGEG